MRGRALAVHTLMALITRIGSICVRPARTWAIIDRESTSPADLVRTFILPLAGAAALAAVAAILAGALPYPFAAFIRVVLRAAVDLARTTGLCVLLALIVNGLATTFGGRPDFNQAFKLSVYGATPVFLGKIAQAAPYLDELAGLVSGLYAVYLYAVGLPILMKSPRETSATYLAAVIVCGMVAGFIFLIGFAGFVMVGSLGARLVT